MVELKLVFWLVGQHLDKLRKAAQTWWEQVETWIRWPLTQTEADTCSLPVLRLLAWQRDIDRFNGEPEWLFRRRVKYAFVNAKDAGSVAGIKRIFERLGIGYVEVEERVTGLDWDIVLLNLSNAQLSQSAELLIVLMKMYGRTCRRYQFKTITPVEVGVEAVEFNHAMTLTTASY